MANDLTMFDPKAGVPAHVANFFGAEGTNILDRPTVPSLSPQGKVWTVSVDGQKTKMEKRDQDGEIVPVSVLRVVVLDYAKRRGRSVYEGAYDPANESAPICWSDDGITPDATVPDEIKRTKTSFKCDTCPMAAKGSKITEQGKAIAACSQHRMLAVVPSHKLDFQPLRLKIAITSDFDKQSPDAEAQGWYAFSNYTDYLKSRGVQHSAAVVTKMKFDANASYPKIFFAAERWLEANELAQVGPLTKSDEVQKLLGGTYTPAGPDGVEKAATTAAVEKPQTAAQQATAATAAAQAPAPDEDDDAGEIIMTGLDAPAAQPAQGAAQAGVAAPEPTATTTAPKAAVAPSTEPAPAVSTDPELGALLAAWGNDD
jgi:hypothetical protein